VGSGFGMVDVGGVGVALGEERTPL